MKFYFILFVFFFCVFPFNEAKSQNIEPTFPYKLILRRKNLKTFVTYKGANRKLQASGKYPAIVYGGKENIPVYGERSKLDSFFLMNNGKTQVINIEIDGKGQTEKKRAIVQDYQYSNIKKKFIHVDFLEVTDNTLLHLEIPIQLVGSSKVAELGGIIQNSP